MKCPEKVIFAFDIRMISLLQNKTALILWACIKTGHITNQYFNDNVEAVAEAVDKMPERTYENFKGIIQRSALHVFGLREREQVMFLTPIMADISDDFWQGIWDYIEGKKELEIEIKQALKG